MGQVMLRALDLLGTSGYPFRSAIGHPFVSMAQRHPQPASSDFGQRSIAVQAQRCAGVP